MRPQVIDHFLGQPQVVEQFRVALEQSWNCGIRLPSMLLVGPPGCGKTNLAKIAAAEIATTIHERIGQVLGSPQAVNALLIEAEDRHVIFIDEIHEMFPPSQTLLYRALEDRTVFVKYPGAKTKALPVSDFTLIAATTDAYAILPPLRDRFEMILEFEWYDADSLAAIVEQRAKREGIALDQGVARKIALRGQGTPRLAIRLLHGCQRYARSRGEEVITMKHFEQAARLEGVDSLGLSREQQRYLRLLAQRDGRAVRLFDLEASLGIHRRSLQRIVEVYLLRANLIERTPTGRRITSVGTKHIQADSLAVEVETMEKT